jgi:hypothetical protein
MLHVKLRSAADAQAARKNIGMLRIKTMQETKEMVELKDGEGGIDERSDGREDRREGTQKIV